MSVAYAKFLKLTDNKAEALKKFIDIAEFNDMTTSVGWTSRIEAAKLILFDTVGKATSKMTIFSWLNNMIQYNNGKYLFTSYILLGKKKTSYVYIYIYSFIAKCHDVELCSGCKKEMAMQFFETGLKYKLNDIFLEVYARVKLIEIYYTKRLDKKLQDQMNAVEPLLDSLPDSPEKKSWSADTYYYKGTFINNTHTFFLTVL